jgi:hypothetical protein
MSRYLGRIATVSLTIGVLSLAIAWAFGGRELGELLHRSTFLAQSCGDGKGGDIERHLPWRGNSIDIALPGTVHFRAGEGSDIVVRGAPDTIANVEVRGGHLMLGCRWSPSARNIEVTLPGQTIRHLGISGSGKLDMDKVSQRELTLSISGSGSLRAQGTVDHLKVRVAGSGDAQLGGLIAKRLNVEISGSGNVEAAPQDEANIRIAGSGNVRLLTRPARLQTHISGSGRISQPQEAAEGKK